MTKTNRQVLFAVAYLIGIAFLGIGVGRLLTRDLRSSTQQLNRIVLSSIVESAQRKAGPDSTVLASILVRATQYPFEGIGVQLATKKRDDGLGVQVIAVYKDSGAAKAGIRPLDWIQSVNGQEVQKVDDESLGRATLTLIQESGSPVKLDIERDGSRFRVTIPKQLVGQDIREYISGHMPAWREHVEGLRSEVNAFTTAVQTADNDNDKLLALTDEGLKLLGKLDVPEIELNAFENSHLIR